MTDLYPVDDVLADDVLLNRLGSRSAASGEAMAALLGALAVHADTPLAPRPGRTRRSRHRYLGAFAALAIAASGAGVAAAVSLPDRGPSDADRARILDRMDDAARSDASSGLFAGLGLPQTNDALLAGHLVLVRQVDGTIVLLTPSQAALVVAGQDQGDGQVGTTSAGGGGNSGGGATAAGTPDGATGVQGNPTVNADQNTAGAPETSGQGRPTQRPGMPTQPAPTSTDAALTTTTGGSRRTPTPTSTTSTATETPTTDTSTDTSTDSPTQ